MKANLCSHLAHFQTEFKVGSFDQSTNAYRYLRGSLQGQTGKRNIQRISEQDQADPYQSLHHFISHSDWDPDSVKGIIQELNKQLLEDQPYGYIIDERSKAKKGNHSVGVSRQYCGSTGKIDNCQTGVYSVLTTGTMTLPSNLRLYLPKDWSEDKKRSKQFGLKDTDSVDKTKVDLALDMIREDRKNGIMPEWYGADSLYGRASRLTTFIEDECHGYFVMDTTKHQQIYLGNPSDRRRKSTTIEKYLKSINLSATGLIRYQGSKKARTHIVEVFIKDSNRKKKPRKRLLIISRGPKKNDKVKYSLSNFSIKQKTPAQLVYMQRARYTIEQYFREASQVAGMGDYQVRSYKAWKHVQILSIMIMQLLATIKDKLSKSKFKISIVAIARCIQPILLQLKNCKIIVLNILRNCTPNANSS